MSILLEICSVMDSYMTELQVVGEVIGSWVEEK